MQHLDEGTIHAWLDDALPADEAARVAAHVASCASCADAVAEARGFMAAASRIVRALDIVPADVVPAPRADVPRAAALPPRPVPWYRRRVVSLAAGFVVMALGSLVAVRAWRTEAPVAARASMDSAARPAAPSSAEPRPKTVVVPAPPPPAAAKMMAKSAMKMEAKAAAELSAAEEPLARREESARADFAVGNAAPAPALAPAPAPPPALAGAGSKIRIRGLSGMRLGEVVTMTAGSQRPVPIRTGVCDSMRIAVYMIDSVPVTLAQGPTTPSPDSAAACVLRTAPSPHPAALPERVVQSPVPTDTLTWRGADGRGYLLMGQASRAKLEQIRDLLVVTPRPPVKPPE